MNDPISTCIQTAADELRQARALLLKEIKAYPTPISGCDAQYNHLLAERNRVLDALERLDTSVFIATPRTPTPHAGIESR